MGIIKSLIRRRTPKYLRKRKRPLPNQPLPSGDGAGVTGSTNSRKITPERRSAHAAIDSPRSLGKDRWPNATWRGGRTETTYRHIRTRTQTCIRDKAIILPLVCGRRTYYFDDIWFIYFFFYPLLRFARTPSEPDETRTAAVRELHRQWLNATRVAVSGWVNPVRPRIYPTTRYPTRGWSIARPFRMFRISSLVFVESVRFFPRRNWRSAFAAVDKPANLSRNCSFTNNKPSKSEARDSARPAGGRGGQNRTADTAERAAVVNLWMRRR